MELIHSFIYFMKRSYFQRMHFHSNLYCFFCELFVNLLNFLIANHFAIFTLKVSVCPEWTYQTLSFNQYYVLIFWLINSMLQSMDYVYYFKPELIIHQLHQAFGTLSCFRFPIKFSLIRGFNQHQPRCHPNLHSLLSYTNYVFLCPLF